MEKLREELMLRMYDDDKTKKIVMEIICKVLKNKTEVSDKTDLISKNILDSISFVKLVSELENIFNIEFDINDLNIDKFKTISLIVENIYKYIHKD